LKWTGDVLTVVSSQWRIWDIVRQKTNEVFGKEERTVR